MLNVSLGAFSNIGYASYKMPSSLKPMEKNAEGTKTSDLDKLNEKKECQTCKNRKYQDESDDSGVSFQTPTHISPSSAGKAVVSHELEHVYREKARAEGESARIVSQSVMIHTSICPECHRVYVSGGTTTTKKSAPVESMFNVGKEEDKSQISFSV